MRNDAMLVIEGTVAALFLFWIVTNPKAVNSITSSSVGAITGSFKQLIGGGKNPMT